MKQEKKRSKIIISKTRCSISSIIRRRKKGMTKKEIMEITGLTEKEIEQL